MACISSNEYCITINNGVTFTTNLKYLTIFYTKYSISVSPGIINAFDLLCLLSCSSSGFRSVYCTCFLQIWGIIIATGRGAELLPAAFTCA